MPLLACQSCGQNIYATSPVESLFADERRCPRCGALMGLERRGVPRREQIRRQNPPDDPGPPPDGDRRAFERRSVQRRVGR
jgi:hypothetical protein